MIALLDIDTPQVVTVLQAALEIGRPKDTIKKWIRRGHLTPCATDARGHLLSLDDVLTVDRDMLKLNEA